MKISSHKIFVVDDDEDDRELLRSAFSEHGVAAEEVELVETASQLFAALDRLSNEALPKLIILDHQAPGSLGTDTLCRLKSSDKYRHIPVAIYSSALTTGIKEELKKEKAVIALEKAATLEQYREHISLFYSLAQ